MNSDLKTLFGDQRPVALVVDDSPRARKQTGRRLEAAGFRVTETASLDAFVAAWRPGLVDVVIADWELSDTEHGDQVLSDIRRRDWEVPFVLISGKLVDDSRRASVLANLLENGRARFVRRGDSGIEQAVHAAIDLQLRRDITLLRLILVYRAAAAAEATVASSRGQVPVQELLADLVSTPTESSAAERPLVKSFADWIASGQGSE